MSIIETVPQVLNHPIFKGVSQNIISEHLTEEKIDINIFAPSSVIITPENKNAPICIVVSGTVEILCNTPDHKVLLKSSGPGTIFGLANIYSNDETFPSIVSAKTETTMMMIEKDCFKKMIESEPKIFNNFLVFLSNKVLYLNKKIASYTAGNNEKKLAFFLCENEIDGVVSTPMSISDIATMLDMGRASLYRAFEKLETEKLISRDGRKIYILNKENLKNYI